MTATNIIRNSALNKVNYKSTTTNTNWCDIRNIANKQELSQHYADIFQKHDLDNKWVLMINPDGRPLQQLSIQGKIDPKKILKVNIHQKNIDLNSIESALEKGHCSAVILCNATLEQAEVLQLTHYAEKGQTQCIILKKQTQSASSHSLIKSLPTSQLSVQLH